MRQAKERPARGPGKLPEAEVKALTSASDTRVPIGRRFHTPVTIHGHKDIETAADLDSCAEINIISAQFAQTHKLNRAKATTPILKAVGALTVPQYGVYKVPISIKDSRGEERDLELLCVAVDRDPRAEGSPVLIGMHTLAEERVHLCLHSREWWFEKRKVAFSLLTPRKFAKVTRDETIVYAITGVMEDEFVPLEDEEEAKAYGTVEDIPEELREFEDVFASDKAGSLPSKKSTDHAIDLVPGATPPYGPIYPLSQSELRELREYIDDNLKKGRIRPSKSPAGAPILFVPKKDGTLRLCVDYRGLNKVTQKNRYALPLISEILDRCQGACFFSKIDIKDAYYRIRIKEGDEWKTAFRTRYGHYEYLVMPFGLTNAPATFQSYIHEALHGLVDTICVVYLDDILIFSKTKEEHTEHIKQVLERMRSAELYAKPSKCSFYKESVEFLGFILSVDGISMDTRRVDTIREWKEPTSFKDVQSFLGFCNFYRRFIYRYSGIAAPLHALMKGSQNGIQTGRFIFGEKERLAFNQLKDAFQQAPLLRHYDPSRAVRIETDASIFAMAGILSQQDDEGRWHPVAFWSRKFTDAERNYGTADQELLAIVESFKHWRHYVEGVETPVEVLSDHHNLQTFMRQQKLNGRQARWCMFLCPFHFVIKHRPGKSNPADAPSRRSDYEGEPMSNRALLPELQRKMADVFVAEEEVPMHRRSHGVTPVLEPTEARVAQVEGQLAAVDPVTGWLNEGDFKEKVACVRDVGIARAIQGAVVSLNPYQSAANEPLAQLLQKAQDQDPDLQKRRGEVDSQVKGRGKASPWSRSARGLLMYKDRVVVPREPILQQELLRLHHDDPLAGHFGTKRTLELLKRHYWWPAMSEAVSDYVSSCGVCQRVVARRHRPYGSLESLPIPRRPWAEISLDFVTGLPPVRLGERETDAILVIVDRFTKYSVFLPVKTTIDAAELAELFHKEIELRFGAPEGIVSDRGSVFTSQFWSEVCYQSCVKRRLSTAFHPQTDGQTERTNQVLEHYLRCFIEENQQLWPKLLPMAQFACNNAINRTTGYSPNYALMGYSPEFRLALEGESMEGEVPEAHARVKKLHEVREKLAHNWARATEAQAKYYNQRHQPMTLKRGDLVLLSAKNIRLKDAKRKLNPRFIGPFRILNAVGKQAYRLALPDKYSRLHNVFHVSLLEPWNRREDAPDEDMPMPDLEDDDDEFEVEEVRDHRKTREGDEYLVKWKGWPSEYNQWVASEDMEGAQRAIRAFHRSKTSRKHGETWLSHK